MCLPIRLPAHVFFTIMKFHNNEIHDNERTPVELQLNSSKPHAQASVKEKRNSNDVGMYKTIRCLKRNHVFKC